MRPLALVLDDQRSEILLLENVLKARGFDVVSAQNPAEASNLLMQYCPHLLMVDIMLGPEVNGLDWLASIRTGPYKHLQAIVMTSSHFTDDVKRAMSLGISDYIIKPADFNILSGKLFKVAKHLETNPAYQYQVPRSHPISCSVQITGQIAGISEVGIAVSSYFSNTKPTDDVEMTTTLFKEIEVQTPNQIAMLNRESEPNRQKLGVPFRVYCQVKGWKEEDRYKLRRWIRLEKLRRSF